MTQRIVTGATVADRPPLATSDGIARNPLTAAIP